METEKGKDGDEKLSIFVKDSTHGKMKKSINKSNFLDAGTKNLFHPKIVFDQNFLVTLKDF